MLLAGAHCGFRVPGIRIKKDREGEFPDPFLFSKIAEFFCCTPKSCGSAILTPVPQYNGNAKYGEDDDGMDKEYVL